MPQIIGLDVGDVRVGVALGERDTKIAFPHVVLPRAKSEAEREILKIIETRKIDTVVVGLPLDEADRETPQCEKVRAFCRRLLKRASVTVVYIDEFHSSIDAAQLQGAAHGRARPTQRQKGMLDAAAAAILLQRFLDTL